MSLMICIDTDDLVWFVTGHGDWWSYKQYPKASEGTEINEISGKSGP